MTADIIVGKLNEHEGQLLGLKVMLAAILAHNPNLKFDKTLANALVAAWPIGGDPALADEIRAHAKAAMQSTLTEGRRA